MSDYRIDVKVRNNHILKKIEDAGYDNVNQLCEKNEDLNGDQNAIRELVNMKIAPLTKEGSFRPVVMRMCEVLGCLPEDLFTEVQKHTSIQSNTNYIEVSEQNLEYMLDNIRDQKSLESIVMKQRIPGKVNDALDYLTPRERKIIEMRFGIGESKKDYTFEECGAQFGISRERVRGIEQKALRKLHSYARKNDLKEYLDVEDDL